MEALGIFAAVCSTSASLPQLCSKSPHTLRIGSIALRCTGGIAWSVYGGLKRDWPLMFASGTVAVIEIILWTKRRKALDRLKTPDTLPFPARSLNVSSPAANAGKTGE